MATADNRVEVAYYKGTDDVIVVNGVVIPGAHLEYIEGDMVILSIRATQIRTLGPNVRRIELEKGL